MMRILLAATASSVRLCWAGIVREALEAQPLFSEAGDFLQAWLEFRAHCPQLVLTAERFRDGAGAALAGMMVVTDVDVQVIVVCQGDAMTRNPHPASANIDYIDAADLMDRLPSAAVRCMERIRPHTLASQMAAKSGRRY